jgi:hypothetical protein
VRYVTEYAAVTEWEEAEENGVFGKKPYPAPLRSQQIPHDCAVIARLRGEKTATNRLSHSRIWFQITALYKWTAKACKS